MLIIHCARYVVLACVYFPVKRLHFQFCCQAKRAVGVAANVGLANGGSAKRARVEVKLKTKYLFTIYY